MNPSQAELERFESLAPWADTPALSATDADWLKAFIAQHPEQAQALKWDATLRRALHQQFAAVPQDIGLAQAMQKIRSTPQEQPQTQAHPMPAPAQRAPQVATPQRPPVKPSGGFFDWLFGGGPRFSPAFAVLLAVAVLPTVLLVQRESAQTQYSEVRSGRQGLFDGPLLRVNFKPDAKEEEIRLLLIEQGGLVVGPTRLGDWFVRVAPARIEQVRSKLAAAGAVAHVDVVQTLPAEMVDQ